MPVKKYTFSKYRTFPTVPVPWSLTRMVMDACMPSYRKNSTTLSLSWHVINEHCLLRISLKIPLLIWFHLMCECSDARVHWFQDVLINRCAYALIHNAWMPRYRKDNINEYIDLISLLFVFSGLIIRIDFTILISYNAWNWCPGVLIPGCTHTRMCLIPECQNAWMPI